MKFWDRLKFAHKVLELVLILLKRLCTFGPNSESLGPVLNFLFYLLDISCLKALRPYCRFVGPTSELLRHI